MFIYTPLASSPCHKHSAQEGKPIIDEPKEPDMPTPNKPVPQLDLSALHNGFCSSISLGSSTATAWLQPRYELLESRELGIERAFRCSKGASGPSIAVESSTVYSFAGHHSDTGHQKEPGQCPKAVSQSVQSIVECLQFFR